MNTPTPEERRERAHLFSIANHPSRINDISDLIVEPDPDMDDVHTLSIVRKVGSHYLVSDGRELYQITVDGRLGRQRITLVEDTDA